MGRKMTIACPTCGHGVDMTLGCLYKDKGKFYYIVFGVCGYCLQEGDDRSVSATYPADTPTALSCIISGLPVLSPK